MKLGKGEKNVGKILFPCFENTKQSKTKSGSRKPQSASRCVKLVDWLIELQVSSCRKSEQTQAKQSEYSRSIILVFFWHFSFISGCLLFLFLRESISFIMNVHDILGHKVRYDAKRGTRQYLVCSLEIISYYCICSIDWLIDWMVFRTVHVIIDLLAAGPPEAAQSARFSGWWQWRGKAATENSKDQWISGWNNLIQWRPTSGIFRRWNAGGSAPHGIGARSMPLRTL